MPQIICRVGRFAIPIASACLIGCSAGPVESPRSTPASSSAHQLPNPDIEDAPAAAPPVLDGTATERDYIVYAALNKPQLKALFHEWKAALARLPQARTLPEPRFTYGYFIEEVETRVGPQQHRLSIAQTFPWIGTLTLREDAASADARLAYHRFEEARLAVVQRVRQALASLALLDHQVALTRDSTVLLAQFERIVRSRYKVGAADHPDLIRVQVELARLNDRLETLVERRPAVVATLNAALGREPTSPIGDVPSSAVESLEGSYDTLAAALLETNPALAAVRAAQNGAQVRTDLADLAAAPDVTLGLSYTVTGDAMDPDLPGSGDDPILVSIGVTLPIWADKYDAIKAEARHRRIALSHRRADTEQELLAALRDALFTHQDAARKVDLYQAALIPKARQSLEAALVAYQADQASALDLIDTQQTLLELELAVRTAQADLTRSHARIESLVGSPLVEEASE